jgi:hypothetical protein
LALLNTLLLTALG